MKIVLVACMVLSAVAINAAEVEAECKTKAAAKAKSPLEHVAHYIGAHAHTPDYAFQESLRQSDLSISKRLEETVGKQKSNTFFVNGWGQVIGALVIMQTHRTSPELNAIVQQNLDEAIKKGREKDNPFINVNVRTQTKNILMYPHQGVFLPWQKMPLTKPLPELNKQLHSCDLKFRLFEGKCYLMIMPTDESTSIFSSLWRDDFAAQLDEAGYHAMEANKESPHITLINSNIIAAIKDKFISIHGTEGSSKFDSFMNNWFDQVNKQLAAKKEELSFTEFNSTYSEDYSPFEETVVARLHAPYVKNALHELAQMIKKEVDYIMAVKQDESFHLSVATKYRKPAELPKKDLADLINIGHEKYRRTLLEFYDAFKKDLI